MNHVCIMGRLVRDPDLRYTSAGTAVANVSLALNRGDDVTYVDVTIWDKRAEAFAKFHSKGDMAAISGRLTQDTWEDKETGQKRSKMKVTCEDWSFTRSKTKAAENF